MFRLACLNATVELMHLNEVFKLHGIYLLYVKSERLEGGGGEAGFEEEKGDLRGRMECRKEGKDGNEGVGEMGYGEKTTG